MQTLYSPETGLAPFAKLVVLEDQFLWLNGLRISSGKRFGFAADPPDDRDIAMSDVQSPFRGLSAFPLTPMDQSGRIQAKLLEKLLDRLVSAGVDSIGLLGSTGTYAYLTRTERQKAIEVAAAVTRGQVPLIVGIGALRTDDAQDLARDAAASGASGLLLAPMSYTPLTEDEVFEHFQTVAQTTSLPLCIYNNPGTTHFTFSASLVERLARIPNIVALKNPAGPVNEAKAVHHALQAKLPGGFDIGYSGDWNAAGALLAGGAAWYSVIGGLFPHLAIKLTRAAQRGDVVETMQINDRLEPLWTLFKQHSSLRVTHAAAQILKLCDTDLPRPILPLSASIKEQVAIALEKLEAEH